MAYIKIGFNSYINSYSKGDLKRINNLSNSESKKVILDYEKSFVRNIGDGYGFSIASGRMAFYLLLKSLGIQKGDEVIVVGFTCSVMINAILRVDATPVYSDVSPVTFGSDPVEIKKHISPKTRLIVAQHSFGIPCEIEEIVSLAKENNIFVLEDCALTIGSRINNKQVGTFGDAAIFSTDHSKPLNTLIGGFFYTENKELFTKVLKTVNEIQELDNKHKSNLLGQLLLEQRWLHPNKYVYFKYYSFGRKVIRKVLKMKKPNIFMDGDNGPPAEAKPQYPYPSSLPAFLAWVGSAELSNFEIEKQRRKNILKKYLNIFSKSIYRNDISIVYTDSNIDIIPLRFVFYSDEIQLLYDRASKFIDFSQVWFKRPIIATSYSMEKFHYDKGSCSNSESIGNKIINFPCIIPKDIEDDYFIMLRKVVGSI